MVDKFKYEIQRMITTNVSEGNNEKKRIYAIILETCLFADKYPVILFANLKTPTMMQNVITRAIEGLTAKACILTTKIKYSWQVA